MYEKMPNENYFEKFSKMNRMEQQFQERTANHIRAVQKKCARIEQYDPERFKGLTAIARKHDQSKYEAPEKEPYVYITWYYHTRDDGTPWAMPADMIEKTAEATEHHVKNNAHHPEFYSQQTDTINKSDRDAPPDKKVIATNMPDIYIAEMVADWVSVSEERGTSPIDWADKNIGVRWEFDQDQIDLIYELIDLIWLNPKVY